MLAKSTALIVSFTLFSCASGAGTPVRKCSGDLPFPLFVQIEDCEALPCVVTKGRVLGMDVQFVATKDNTMHLETNIRANVLGIVVPYPLAGDSANVCKNLLYGAYCPLYAGEDVTYHIDFPLENSVPEVSVKCEVKITDSDKEVVACFMADLKVRKPKGDTQ